MFRKLAALSLAMVASIGLVGCSSDDGPLVMVGIPLDADQEVEARYLILMDMVTESTGKEVEFLKATDYATAVEAIASGRADLAILDPLSYVTAMNKDENLNLVAVGARAKDVVPEYFSYGFARTDSGIGALADLAGKKICVSDPNSIASFLLPAASLAKAGISMSALEVKDVEVVTTGTLPQVAVSVAAGDCDAGFIVDSFYDVVVPKSGLVDMGLLTKFWTSDPFPSTALVSGDRVSAEQVTALGKKLNELGNKPALIEAGICADQESCMFLSSSTWGLVAGDDAYYDVVRDLCAVLELDSCK